MNNVSEQQEYDRMYIELSPKEAEHFTSIKLKKGDGVLKTVSTNILITMRGL